MEIFDSHCHPQFPQYDKDREEMINRNLESGTKMICIGTDLEKSKKAIELAKKYDGIWATVGLHPNDSSTNINFDEFEKLLNKNKVIGIGEIGLDYYRTERDENQNSQRDIFRKFIELGLKNNKKFIFHIRDLPNSKASAYDDAFKILSEYKNIKGVIHSFTESWDVAEKFLKMGLYIGLNGIITFIRPNFDKQNSVGQADKGLTKVVKNIPLDRLLIETDAPFLSPAPHRGERNEPMRVKYVAEHIAKIRGISLDKVISQANKNTERLFEL